MESYSIALRAVFVGVTVVNLATVLFCAPIEELELDGKKTATAGQAGQVGVEHEHEREGRAGQRGECETGR